ncbi:hypothetical protein JCM1840_001785 [Sporobolomyces johnsonii]
MALPILIVNPNTTESMTRGLETMLEPYLASSPLRRPTFWTAPSGVPSINSLADCHTSALACLPALVPLLSTHSAVLVACYSVHPLVDLLQPHPSSGPPPPPPQEPKPILGIFEASVLACLAHIGPTSTTGDGDGDGNGDERAFGIVSTGKAWEPLLAAGVRDLLLPGGRDDRDRPGAGSWDQFAGVETTGLDATELHDAPPALVRERIKAAVKRLIRRAQARGQKLGAVCLGCAGMAGMDETVREACVEELGAERGRDVEIVDGVKAGWAMLDALVRAN